MDGVASGGGRHVRMAGVSQVGSRGLPGLLSVSEGVMRRRDGVSSAERVKAMCPKIVRRANAMIVEEGGCAGGR